MFCYLFCHTRLFSLSLSLSLSLFFNYYVRHHDHHHHQVGERDPRRLIACCFFSFPFLYCLIREWERERERENERSAKNHSVTPLLLSRQNENVNGSLVNIFVIWVEVLLLLSSFSLVRFADIAQEPVWFCFSGFCSSLYYCCFLFKLLVSGAARTHTHTHTDIPLALFNAQTFSHHAYCCVIFYFVRCR